MAQKPHSLEGTWIAGDYVRHYTCNPASTEYLRENEIIMMGAELGCRDSREVLLIPRNAYNKRGLPVRASDAQIISETLMRILSEEEASPKAD